MRTVEVRGAHGTREGIIPLDRAVQCLRREGYRDWAEELAAGEPIYLPGKGGLCFWPMWTED